MPVSAEASQAAGGSLFTEVFLHVCLVEVSLELYHRVALQKLNLELCPGCCLVERTSRTSILDLVSFVKRKFSFSFCLFEDRTKVRQRRVRKRKR